MTKYSAELAWQLELRSVSDGDMAEAKREVDEVLANGGDPRIELGPPSEYALSYPVCPEKKKGTSRAINAAGILAALWMLGAALVIKLTDAQVNFALVALIPALALVCGAIAWTFSSARKRARRFA